MELFFKEFQHFGFVEDWREAFNDSVFSLSSLCSADDFLFYLEALSQLGTSLISLLELCSFYKL
jgi:hypothetical protein